MTERNSASEALKITFGIDLILKRGHTLSVWCNIINYGILERKKCEQNVKSVEESHQ